MLGPGSIMFIYLQCVHGCYWSVVFCPDFGCADIVMSVMVWWFVKNVMCHSMLKVC